MREIKFRAWDEVHKKMYFPERLFCKKDGTVWHVDLGDTSRIIGQQGFKLMQYTGLKDKNGTEIYEGDIVRYKSFFSSDYVLGVVEYTEQAEWAVDMRLLSRIYSNVEVIGNIYEHPHLLGGEEE
jgi:uncharacterized phage protein (TIGR01671 family)